MIGCNCKRCIFYHQQIIKNPLKKRSGFNSNKMKYYFHFTYETNNNTGRLWYVCHLTVNSQKEAEQKAARCMSKFKEPKLVALKIIND